MARLDLIIGHDRITWDTVILRLRHDGPAEPGERLDPLTILDRLDNIEARLDGFSEQQGRSERILCDRMAAQAELFASQTAKLIARVQKLE